MGKAPKSRHSARSIPAVLRTDPVPADHDTFDVNDPIPVIQKVLVRANWQLGAVEANDRAWACAAISNVFQTSLKARKLLLSRGAIQGLVERISDPEPECILEATGALR